VDNLLRTMQQHHVQLSVMADTKASQHPDHDFVDRAHHRP
jgi:hypothetical protein